MIASLRTEVAALMQKPLDTLKFLLPLGEVPHDVIVRGVGQNIGDAIAGFRRTCLVLEREDRQPGGIRSFWRIPEEFKPVLQDVLFPSLRNDSQR